MKIRFLFWTAALWVGIFLFVPGCREIIHVEQVTPEGSVPARSITPTASKSNQQKIPINDSKKSPILKDNNHWSRGMNRAQIITDFKNYYRRKGQRRIAVFFNKKLSDDVEEWCKENRTTITTERIFNGSKNSISRSKKNNMEHLKDREQISVVIGREIKKSNSLSDRRIYPRELWMMAFQEGFIEVFREAGTNIIDRSTIMRLVATEESKNEVELNAKTIEMEALKGYVDIFIELRIIRDFASPLGYSFNATAKDVKRGSILVMTNIMNWKNVSISHKESIAPADRGYIRQIDEFPTVKMVAEQLALNIMSKLFLYWTNWQG